MTPAVRPYRPADLPALYDICLRTADAGEDATGRYPAADRELPGAVVAVPGAPARRPAAGRPARRARAAADELGRARA